MKDGLINIPIGKCGMIGEKTYEAKGAEYFGAKGCLVCDLHEVGHGCTNKKVVCYSPPRVFKEKLPDYEQDNSYDSSIYCDDIATPYWLLILAVILLGFIAIPVHMYIELKQLINKILRKWKLKK